VLAKKMQKNESRNIPIYELSAFRWYLTFIHRNATTICNSFEIIVGRKRNSYSSLFIRFCLAKFFASLKETLENGTKKPSVEPGNRVPRVKVLNYLTKVALFF